MTGEPREVFPLVTGARPLPDGWRERSRTELTIGDLVVLELVLVRTDGTSTHKLMWCRPPFEGYVVDGRPNPVAHADYAPNPRDPDDRTAETACRRRVRRAFVRHWGIPASDPDVIIDELCDLHELRATEAHS